MKHVIAIILAIFCTGVVFAQSNFNEPPTRSEFEQLKSKVQLYEKRQRNSVATMNKANKTLESTLLEIDSLMTIYQNKADSLMMNTANMQSNSSDINLEAYALKDDIKTLENKITVLNNSFNNRPIDNHNLIYILFGSIFILIIITYFSALSKSKKVRSNLLHLQKESFENLEKKLNMRMTSTEKMLESAIDKINTDLLTDRNKQNTALNKLDTKTTKNLSKIQDNLANTFKECTLNIKTEFEDHFKKIDAKIKRNNTNQKKLINDIKESMNTDEIAD